MGSWIGGSALVGQYRGGESVCTGFVEIAEVGGEGGALPTGGKTDGHSDGFAPLICRLFQMTGEHCQIVTDASGWSGGDGRRGPGRTIRLCGGHATGECHTFDQREGFAHDRVSGQSSEELTLFHAR